MGNCFCATTKRQSTQRNKIIQIENFDQKKEKKLQDYLKIDKDSLQIDLHDLNTTFHPSFPQIAKDIDRTYPNQPYFKNPDSKKILEKVLKRIALHYPKIGYTQGINFVAGSFLLAQMSELEAYKSFVALLVHPKLMYFGYYEDQFPLVRLNCSLFWQVFSEKCKIFAQKIKAISVPDQMWIFQWFICFYIYNFPFEYIQQLMHFILQQKYFASVRIAVAIMILLQKKFENVNQQFQEEFIQSIEYLKDYDYCKKQIPLSNIISTAYSINPSEIKNCLTKDSKNWYENYFGCSQKQQHDLFTIFLKEKEKERKQFFGKVKSGITIVTYERNRNSVEVIDNIQGKKLERYQKLLYHSLKVQSAHSFIRNDKRMSLTNIRGNLVESIYNT